MITNQNKKKQFTELAKAKIQDTRNVVISRKDNDGFTIAQQLEVTEKKRVTTVFMQNSIHIDNIQGLYNLRDALNVAIQKQEEESKEQEWDK
jgi:hypothetical protein